MSRATSLVPSEVGGPEQDAALRVDDAPGADRSGGRADRSGSGLHLTLRSPRWKPMPGHPVAEAAAIIRSGGRIAVTGAGGYRIVCDATSKEAVAELRRRKASDGRPFAVLFTDERDVMNWFALSEAELSALRWPGAPIVVLAERGRAGLAENLAPGLRGIGVMLPADSTLASLVQSGGRPLAITSGNRSGEPVCIEDGEARRRLARLVDGFLVDGVATARCDDPVVRVRGDTPIVLRHGRGSAPKEITLPFPGPAILATGGGSEIALCLAEGERALLGPSVGRAPVRDAAHLWTEAFMHLQAALDVEPTGVAVDEGDEFGAGPFARSLGLPVFPVGHDHGRIAAVMAEHGLTGRVIGVVLDAGRGGGQPGPDHEFVIVDEGGAKGAGRFRPTGAVLLEAVAGLSGVCDREAYPGRAAALLEAVADGSATHEYPFDVGQEDGEIVVDTEPIVAAVVNDVARGRTPGEVAGRFHRTLAAAVVAVCRLTRGATGLTRVCLAGGMFANDLLVSDVAARLGACDFDVFVPRDVPPGDGGLALGQVLVASAAIGVDAE